MEYIDSVSVPWDIEPVVPTIILPTSTDRPFMQANTVASSLQELRDKHIIPVFVKDNEPVISHTDFIEATQRAVEKVFSHQQILQPSVRLSHPVMGRIPDAKHKPAIELAEHEKTLYYERMAFVIEVPSYTAVIGGNTLSLTIGGVKAYNLDNLYNKKGADEHFKVFIGFQNKVCTNLCVWTDGYQADLKVNSIGSLKACIQTLIENYNPNYHLQQMEQLTQYSLTEQQFAQVIGRCRMYQHLPNHLRSEIPAMMMGDTQIGAICKDFYRDESFSKNEDGSIDLWRLYNLFTGANKSSYIDSFLDRSVNAYAFVEQLRWTLERKQRSWYLN